jgi:hypothetical protein
MKKKQNLNYRSKFVLILLLSTQTAYSTSLLERYWGSQQEQALDAQIKAYRKNAINNMKTFGPSGLKSFDLPLKNRALVLQAEMELKTNKQTMPKQAKTLEFRSPVRSRVETDPRKKNIKKKGNSNDYANRRKGENRIGSR